MTRTNALLTVVLTSAALLGTPAAHAAQISRTAPAVALGATSNNDPWD